MIDLIPYIEHLPPPDLVRMTLCRFSPYFVKPEEHGIQRIRARAFYDALYQGSPDLDVSRMAYQFDYDHEMFADDELTQTLRDFARAMKGWSGNWHPDKAYYEGTRQGLTVQDERRLYPARYRMTGVAAEVYRYLDRTRPVTAVARQFKGLQASVLQCLQDTWRARRWLIADSNGRRLAVLPERPRQTPSVNTDA